MIRRPTIGLLLALPACVIGGDRYPRPRDLEPSWKVDRTRLLAVRAEPPEIAPGEQATFEALMPQPDHDPAWPLLWFACPIEPGDAGFGCNLDFAGTPTDTGLEEGFLGIEPGLPPVYTAPLDLLDPLEDPQDRAEGLQVLAQVAAIPPELLEDPEAAIDFDTIEMGFKRLVVSEASTPNANPAIFEFVVDRLTVPRGALTHVHAGQQYELGVVLEEARIEEYEFLNSEGVVETRREEPYATWFSTGGEIHEAITLYPYTETTWTAPEAGESGTWYAVVRDRRGGITWAVQDWVVD